MKPIIGITGLIDTKKQSYWMLPDYIHMIEDRGGIPMILSFSDDPDDVSQELDHIDGLLLTGGQDIQPSLYHELQLEYCGETSLVRDACEYELIKQALARDLPIFGICRGVQILNVYFGGTLYQGLDEQYHTYVHHHMTPPYGRAVHRVNLYGKLKDIMQTSSIEANSYHHQAIKNLAPDLFKAGVSEDDLIEAVCLDDHKFVVGVQWHPEWLYRKDEANDHLVKAFVEACK
jgi:putative glutamine amidotransferase